MVKQGGIIMYTLILESADKTIQFMQNITDFKKEKEVVIFETFDGYQKIIKGKIKEITDNNIFLEVDKSRIAPELAPLNF
jgi:hypothetical protein